MTLLKVHDLQQELAGDFLTVVRNVVRSAKDLSRQKELIYLRGQEMGFCNDDIDVLLEDFVQQR